MVNHSVNIHRDELLWPPAAPALSLLTLPTTWQLTQPRHTQRTSLHTRNWHLISLLISSLTASCSYSCRLSCFSSAFNLFAPSPLSFRLFLLRRSQFLWEHAPHHVSRLRAHRDRRPASTTEDDRRYRDPVQSQPPHFQVEACHLVCY